MWNRCLFWMFCLSGGSLWAALPIVFVHLGPSFPSHLSDAVSQARLFNPFTEIYLIASQEAFSSSFEPFSESRPICIEAESLPLSPEHLRFQRTTRLDSSFREGFWRFTTERFFYLHALMKAYHLPSLLHLESDNLLYADLSLLEEFFLHQYPDQLAGAFDHDLRCIASCFYVGSPKALHPFLQFINQHVGRRWNDMDFLAHFAHLEKVSLIGHLPILPSAYVQKNPLINLRGDSCRDPLLYAQGFEEARSVFDAAALGQFLGGIDPRNGPSTPGFINETTLFNPSSFTYTWQRDEQERWVPFLEYEGTFWRINNLHIHSKQLTPFLSRRTHP